MPLDIIVYLYFEKPLPPLCYLKQFHPQKYILPEGNELTRFILGCEKERSIIWIRE
jgi:hypothetical protein